MLRSLLLVAGAALVLAPAAVAGPIVDEAAASLEGDPVYVDPDAERALTSGEEQRLEEAIADADAGPMYVAVLPEAAQAEAGGSAGEVLRQLIAAVGRDGTYAVVAGDSFRAASNVDDGDEAEQAATEAFQDSSDQGTAAVLGSFVTLFAADGDGSGGGFPWLIAALAAGGGLAFWLVRRRRCRERAVDLEEVKQEARADLLALADDVRALDEPVESNAAAKEDYYRALDSYESGGRALDRARTAAELEAVSTALEEGRYAMASAKARLEGREPPERRPPCFFDPRHGPSTRDVEWAPAGGVPRDVPACEADAQRVEQGLEPAAREVTVHGRPVPYWDASPAYGPYAAGFFGGYAGVFPAIMIGSVLGGGFDSGGGDGGGFGGGDWGGGGGDFGGGGDWGGGGDFGGGGGGQ